MLCLVSPSPMYALPFINRHLNGTISPLALMDYWLSIHIYCRSDNRNDVHLNSAFHTDTHFTDISDGR